MVSASLSSVEYPTVGQSSPYSYLYDFDFLCNGEDATELIDLGFVAEHDDYGYYSSKEIELSQYHTHSGWENGINTLYYTGPLAWDFYSNSWAPFVYPGVYEISTYTHDFYVYELFQYDDYDEIIVETRMADSSGFGCGITAYQIWYGPNP